MENIDVWERGVAQQHHLHGSWLAPAAQGTVCACCGKLRDYRHYIRDTSVCVFCSVACKDGQSCNSMTTP